MTTEAPVVDIKAGRFKKELAFSYGFFTGYDIVFVDKNGNDTTVAKDVDPIFAEHILASLTNERDRDQSRS